MRTRSPRRPPREGDQTGVVHRGAPPFLPVRPSVAAFYRGIVEVHPSDEPSDGRVRASGEGGLCNQKTGQVGHKRTQRARKKKKGNRGIRVCGLSKGRSRKC